MIIFIKNIVVFLMEMASKSFLFIKNKFNFLEITSEDLDDKQNKDLNDL